MLEMAIFNIGAVASAELALPDASGLMPLALPECFLDMRESRQPQPSADAVRRFTDSIGAPQVDFDGIEMPSQARNLERSLNLGVDGLLRKMEIGVRADAVACGGNPSEVVRPAEEVRASEEVRPAEEVRASEVVRPAEEGRPAEEVRTAEGVQASEVVRNSEGVRASEVVQVAEGRPSADAVERQAAISGAPASVKDATAAIKATIVPSEETGAAAERPVAVAAGNAPAVADGQVPAADAKQRVDMPVPPTAAGNVSFETVSRPLQSGDQVSAANGGLGIAADARPEAPVAEMATTVPTARPVVSVETAEAPVPVKDQTAAIKAAIVPSGETGAAVERPVAVAADKAPAAADGLVVDASERQRVGMEAPPVAARNASYGVDRRPLQSGAPDESEVVLQAVPMQAAGSEAVIAPASLVEAGSVAAATARTEAVAETVSKVVDAVVGQMEITPSLVKGEGEVRMTLKPTVLDGSEIRLSAKGGSLTVAVTPATSEAAQAMSAALPRLETALAEHVSVFSHVAVRLVSKKGKIDESA